MQTIIALFVLVVSSISWGNSSFQHLGATGMNDFRQPFIAQGLKGSFVNQVGLQQVRLEKKKNRNRRSQSSPNSIEQEKALYEESIGEELSYQGEEEAFTVIEESYPIRYRSVGEGVGKTFLGGAGGALIGGLIGGVLGAASAGGSFGVIGGFAGGLTVGVPIGAVAGVVLTPKD